MSPILGDNRAEMMVDAETNNNEGGGGSESSLKVKVAELERQLRDEKNRFSVLESQAEVEKFVARQEVEKYRRDCSSFEDRVARLEQDCDILRERVLRDQGKIRGLLEEIETKEKEFKERFIELKVENRDLECGRRRAQDEVDEWRRKYVELEAEKSRTAKGVEGSSARPLDEVDDELPERAEEGIVLTPEQKRSGTFVEVDGESEGEGEGERGCDDDDKEDDNEVPIGQFRKKRCVEAADGTKKACGSKSSRSRGCGGVSRRRSVSLLPCEVGNAGGKATVAEVAEAQIPPMPENSTQEDLEISRNSKSLLEVATSKYKLLTRNRSPRPKKKFKPFSLRRSSTARNSVTSDCDGVATDPGLRSYRKRKSGNPKKQKEYTGRVASSEQQQSALTRAEELQKNLNTKHPLFVKSLTRSNVSSCFWLGFPPKFCEENLPAHELKMVVEDEKGLEHKVNYLGSRGGLCGGWKGFASGHNLEIGDALVFELSEPTKFKVYIIKANQESTERSEDKIAGEHTDGIIKQANTNRVRRIPLRFRLVKRNPDMGSRVEGQQA